MKLPRRFSFPRFKESEGLTKWAPKLLDSLEEMYSWLSSSSKGLVSPLIQLADSSGWKLSYYKHGPTVMLWFYYEGTPNKLELQVMLPMAAQIERIPSFIGSAYYTQFDTQYRRTSGVLEKKEVIVSESSPCVATDSTGKILQLKDPTTNQLLVSPRNKKIQITGALNYIALQG